MKIWTIGTSNRSIDEFLSLLEAYQIKAIVDVRRFPTSKHKHFKQENLKASLNQNGIEYYHVTELGGYRKGGYKKYMGTEEFEKGLLYIETLGAGKRVAIMCAELLSDRCHRRFIADALKLRGHTVIHIIDAKESHEHKGKHESKTLDEFLHSIPAKHKKGARKHYKCAILTISTSKYRKKEKGEEPIGDTSGEIAKEMVMKNGHEVVYYNILPDKENKIYEGITKALNTDADFIITSGGTGLTKSDVTIEVVSKLIDKEMQGFGELFRQKSYGEIGTAAVLSRAIAGVIRGKTIFCLPGSPDAVRLALNEIIIPEIAHIMKHVGE